jgi:PST family polysaccharide transporter
MSGGQPERGPVAELANDPPAVQPQPHTLGSASLTPEPEQLDRSLVRGVAWTGSVKWLIQLVSWPITIITARILSPSDYGVLASITVYTSAIRMLTEAGVGAAIVSGPLLSESRLRQINALSTAISTAAFLLILAVAWPLMRALDRVDLFPIVIAYSSTLVLEGLTLVPNARVRRDFRFKELALVEAGRNIADQGVTLVLAFAGAGLWSLVTGYATGMVVSTVLLIAIGPTGFARPILDELRGVMRYSAQMVLRNTASYLASSSDKIVGGRVVASGDLGGYVFAGILALAPVEKVTSIITRVTPALFGRVRDDKAVMRRYVLRITEIIALFTLPAFAGLALVADDLVAVVLGPKWASVVTPLRWFSVYAALTEFTAIIGHALQASDDIRPLARNAVAGLFLYPIGFVVGAWLYGANGLALTWAVVGPGLALHLLLVLCRRIELPLGEYVRNLVPTFVCTGIMVATVLAVRAAPGLPAGAWRLGAAALTGAATYALVGATVYRTRTRQLVEFARRQRAAAAA